MLPVNMQVGHRWKCIYPWPIWPIQKNWPIWPTDPSPIDPLFTLIFAFIRLSVSVLPRFVPREWSKQGTPMFQHIEWDGMGLVVMRPRLMAAKGQSQSSQLGADGVECRTFVPGHFAPPWKSSSRTSASVPWPNPLLTLSLITLTLALIILTLTLLTPTVTINSNHMTLNSYPNQGGCQWWGFPGADVRGGKCPVTDGVIYSFESRRRRSNFLSCLRFIVPVPSYCLRGLITSRRPTARRMMPDYWLSRCKTP